MSRWSFEEVARQAWLTESLLVSCAEACAHALAFQLTPTLGCCAQVCRARSDDLRPCIGVFWMSKTLPQALGSDRTWCANPVTGITLKTLSLSRNALGLQCPIRSGTSCRAISFAAQVCISQRDRMAQSAPCATLQVQE